MKFLYTNTSVVLFILVLASLWFSACSKNDDSKDENHEGHAHAEEEHGRDHDKEKTGEDEGHEGHAHAEEGHEGDHEEGHEGHEHGENEAPDLDRPVSELFEENCEHNMKAHECDECRYEVGVVKAREELFKNGLLKIVTAETKTVSKALRLTGEVQYDERRVAHVSTQVDGIIRKVHVTMGDKVTKGQPLMEMDSVEIGQTKAAYHEALAIERLARKNRDRIEALRKEGISSEKEMLIAKQELEAAEIRTNAARGMLKRLGMGGMKKDRTTSINSSGRLILRAPSDGTILSMHAVTGEVAKSDMSLVTIGDNAVLWVWADLYEQDFARVVTQQADGNLQSSVYVKAFPGQPFPGTVDFINPSMSESSRTIKVRVTVPNPAGMLLAGMFADVDIFLAEDKEALSLPADAILDDEGRSFVFIHHKGDYFVRRPVVKGNDYHGWVEIKEGLKGQETVVADGAFLLKSDVLRSKMGAGCAD